MQIDRKKTLTSAIALLLMLTVGASLVFVQTANAHDPPWTIPSFAYLVLSPNPVGVGQKVAILMWVDLSMPNSALTNDIRRQGYKLTITKPDNAVQTLDWPVVEDTTNVQYVSYTPDQVGKYTFKFDYAGQVYTWNETAAMRTWTNDIFLPASVTRTLTVQQEPLPDPILSYPLPTEYWTRPIEGQNTDWWVISSNWLRGPYIGYGSSATEVTLDLSGRFKPDGIAPNSAHVMWSKPLQDGGVVGGSGVGVDGNTYYMGGSYNVRFSAAIVMYGRLYYAESYGNSGGGGDYVCVDLRTGKEIWRTNTTDIGVPSFGYLYAYDTPNQHGVIPEGWLFTSNFARAYDPSTGRVSTLNITNVPSGTEVAGPKGEILRYVLSSTGKWLAQWNSSKVFDVQTSGNIAANVPFNTTALGTNTYWNGSMWVSNAVRTAQGYTATQWTTPSYDWNVTIPTLGPGTWSINRYAIFDNILLLQQGSLGTGPRALGDGANITAISLKPTSRGQVLWTKYYPEAAGNVTRKIIAVDPVVGVFVTEDKETLRLTGFSLTNGNQMWSSAHAKADIDTLRTTGLAAYGNLYCAGFDGILYAYDLKDGSLLWTYGNGGPGNSTYAGLATVYGHYPIFVNVVADGKIYLATTEHSPGSPFYKNTKYRCVNATDGTEIWTLMGWGTGMYTGGYDVVADGFFVFLNCYDMQIYCVGKGPSALTVSAPDVGVELGRSLVIRGTVTDIAAGTEQDVIAKRFPNGVPAVSDKSMGAWMEYVYMQKPKPTDAIGVPVKIEVIDTNNNRRTIGTATSDLLGTFALAWTPDIEGEYKVIATFEGSESYWPASAATSFVVDPAAQPESPEYPQPIDNTMTIIGVGVAILVAIAIVGAVIVLLLRKRP